MRTNSYPLNESLLFKCGLPVGFLGLLWAVLPSLTAGATLYVSAWLYGVSLDQSFVALLLVVLALCALIMQPSRNILVQLTYAGRALAMETLARWFLLLFALLMIAFVTKSTAIFSRRALLTWALLTPTLVVVGSLAIQHWMRQLTRRDAHHRRVLFAGCNESSIALAHQIGAHPELCMSVAGFFDDRSVTRLGAPELPHLGRLSDLTAYATHHRVDIIFIALPIGHVPRVLELLDDLRNTTASIYYLPEVATYNLVPARTGEVLGFPVVAICETPLYGLRRLAKRLFDLVVAGTLFAIALPFLIVIAILIRLDSPGPALFRQRRYGLDGEEIVVYKLRTMTVTEDGDSIRQASRNDARITQIGRWLRRTSLDELPQLLNVLQGNMSLVGPRPHAVAHNETYRKLIKGYMMRHKVLPGITGLAQIKGFRGEIKEVSAMERRVECDLEYLRRWSLFLDIKILAATARKVMSDENAY